MGPNLPRQRNKRADNLNYGNHPANEFVQFTVTDLSQVAMFTGRIRNIRLLCNYIIY